MKEPFELQRERRLAELLDACLQLPEEQRRAYVEAHYSDDPALLTDALSLLEEPPVELHSPATYLGLDWTQQEREQRLSSDLLAERDLGEYRLHEHIGAGGMGLVFRATHRSTGEVVALKVLLPGRHNREALARFSREAAVLEELDHPSIARIHGRDLDSNPPWIAMEFLPDALDVVRFARERRLDSSGILHLLRQALEALEVIHRAAVVHRDLKPSNLLVDAHGRLAVIDFGVAYTNETRFGAKRLTRTGGNPGTWAYMSPEQLRGDPVGPASDLYSLGVVAFELFCGRVPFEPQGDSFDRQVLQRPAPRPSNMASVPAGLDAVLLKALRKSPNKRYPSADSFARDLDRILAGQAPQAQPPSSLYEFSGFLGLHRSAIATTAGLLLVLVGGWGLWRRTVRAEGLQRENETAVAELIESLKEEEPDRTSELIRRLRELRLLEAPAPLLAAVRSVGETLVDDGEGRLARELLAEAEAHLVSGVEMNSEERVALSQSMGGLYFDFGDYRRALACFERWSAERGGEVDRDSLRAQGWRVLAHLSMEELKEAEPLVLDLLEQRTGLLGPDHLETVQTLGMMARLYRQQGHAEDAEMAYLDVLDVLENEPYRSTRDRWITEANLSHLYLTMNRLEEAELRGSSALAGLRGMLDEEDPEVLAARNNLASIWLRMGRHDLASQEFEALAALQERTLGPDNSIVLRTRLNLANSLEEMGQIERAIDLVEDIHRQFLDLEGPQAEFTLIAEGYLRRLRAR